MADILDAAKPISPPPEPPPVSAITPEAKAPQINPLTGSDSLIVPPKPDHHEVKTDSPPPPPPPNEIKSEKKRPGKKGILIAGLLMILLTLPIAVFFISQRSASTDIRSRAVDDGTYPTITPTATPIPSGGSCQDGTGTADPDNWLICECGSQMGCSSYNDTTTGGGGWGWVCNQNCRKVPRGTNPQGDCTQIDTIRPGGQDYCAVVSVNCPESCRGSTPPGDNTPTLTPTTIPIGAQCSRIALYQNEQLLTDYSSLQPGNIINICATGGNEEKARLRINGGAWTEVSTKTGSGEYCMDFTIPSDTVQFTIEAEVFGNGAWQ
jgi:hypothetical protein